MAAGDTPQASLAPPAVTALRGDGGKDGVPRTVMERTISMDIREEREDLKRAAEESQNAILELDLEAHVRWVSPSWQDMTGFPASSIIGKPIADLLVDNHSVFADCVEAIRKDDSKSRIIRFSVTGLFDPIAEDVVSADDKTPVEPKPGMDTIPALDEEQDGPNSKQPEQQEGTIELEAQGIMVYDRASGEESHTMWMIKPAISREITIDLPDVLVDSLGIGAEMLASYLTLLADVGSQDPENHPPPMPVLCRLCERQITPWWFEKHTELCSQEHRAEMEIQLVQESLNEQRSAIVKVLDALEAQTHASSSRSPSDGGSPVLSSRAEYKGLTIGPTSAASSGHSSRPISPNGRRARSREASSSGFGHARARSFAVRRPLARIVELVMDLCDTAMEINTPSIKEHKSLGSDELRTQSPQSESRIQQVMQWQSPSGSTLENEQGMTLLCDDTAQLANSKVEAVFRHRRILEYSERIRVEYDILVQECIEAAVVKAARIAAGELSDSSDDGSSRYETPEEPMVDSDWKEMPDQIR